MSYRHRAAFGKRQEFIAVAELLRRGFDVYLTLVDDKHIDCVVRREEDDHPVYLDIQIKARSKECNPKNAGSFPSLKVDNPRANFYFVFYSEQANAYWVMSSEDLVQEAYQNKRGKNEGTYGIDFVGQKKGKVTPRTKFERYRDNFDILKRYTGGRT